MQRFTKTFTSWAATAVAVTGAIAPLSSQVSSSPAVRPAVHAVTAAAAVAAVAAPAIQREPAAPAIRLDSAAKAPVIAFASTKPLREQIRFETVRWGGKRVKTLDEASRIQLAQAAAEKARLHEVGLDYRDVYGVIEAETSWIPRDGMGNNGVASYGLAQFEPRTARGLGLKDPNDPVQAVYAAAVNMKHGAEWAADKIDHLKLPPEQYAAKLREGVSIYYNLSVKGRNKWDGENTAQLPVETRRHIRNVRAGAAEAAQLARELLDT